MSDEVEQIDEITARLRGHYCMSGNDCMSLVDEAAAEIERLRGAVDRLVKGMAHPDRCPASYGPMHRCDCGVQKLIDSVMP
jgi:hypothetical protein